MLEQTEADAQRLAERLRCQRVAVLSDHRPDQGVRDGIDRQTHTAGKLEVRTAEGDKEF
jgi:hypothetical protein